MAKETRHNIIFDSGWEADYYDLLIRNNIKFTYHPNKVKISDFNYEPDFIEYYPIDEENIYTVTLIEIKATYNPWSATKDKMLDTALKMMIKHDQNYLLDYVRNYYPKATEVKYRKIKYLVKEGFVDFSFKSPTQKDMWKAKALKYEGELKIVNKNLKKALRLIELADKVKLTKSESVRAKLLFEEMFVLIDEK